MSGVVDGVVVPVSQEAASEAIVAAAIAAGAVAVVVVVDTTASASAPDAADVTRSFLVVADGGAVVVTGPVGPTAVVVVVLVVVVVVVVVVDAGAASAAAAAAAVVIVVVVVAGVAVAIGAAPDPTGEFEKPELGSTDPWKLVFWPQFPIVWRLSKGCPIEPCKVGKMLWNKTESRAPFPAGSTVAAANEPFVAVSEPGNNVFNNCGWYNGTGETPAGAIGRGKSDAG